MESAIRIDHNHGDNATEASGGLVRAMAWAATGSLLFTIMWVLPKLAGAAVSPLQTGFLRYAAGAVCIAPFFFMGANPAPGLGAGDVKKPRLMLMHLARAACGVTSLVLGAYAVTRIPLANVQAIAMTNGVFTVLFAAAFLRERVGLREIIAGLVALTGAVIVAGPGTEGATGLALAGVLAAFAQAIFWGGEVVLLRATASLDRASRILLLVNVWAALMVFVVGVWFWESLSLEVFLLISAMGPIAIVGQLCNIRAFRQANATALVPVRYSGIIFAAIIGMLFFDEWPDPSAILGAVMIIGGAMWLALRSR
ncbi:MAG: DMT family transporter [Rhodospirillales bacterium]